MVEKTAVFRQRRAADSARWRERLHRGAAVYPVGVDGTTFERNGMAVDLLRAVYRNSGVDLSIRMRAAMACLPFESPKLAVVAQVTENDIATILDRRIARYQQMNQIAAANNQKVINGETTVSDR